MGSLLRPWTLAVALVLAVFSLVLSVYLLRFSGVAPSTSFGEVILAEANTGAGRTISSGGIGTTTPTTRYAPTNIKNTLYPGELPGYTGWPRPTSTLAGLFRIVGDSADEIVVVGKNWTCSIHCSHAACLSGGSLFYVRAYGPAILPGQYTDHRNGTYDFTFLPLDEGSYTVEVVLTFSDPPAFSEFPVAVRREPAYEGYMLPGFPAAVSVKGSSSSISDSDPPLPLCTLSQLLESGPSSALQTGRWLVQEKNTERISIYNQSYEHSSKNSNSNDDITLDGYAEGYNALGVRTEHRPTKCSLLDIEAVRGNNVLQQCLQSSTQNAKTTNATTTNATTPMLRLILIGDSNMAAQIKWAENYAVVGDHFPHSSIMGWGGLNHKLPAMKKEIKELLLNDQRQLKAGLSSDRYQYVVIFNSGLHDIMSLCASNKKLPGNARCGDLYRRKLLELVQVVQEIPSVLTVFQTSHAAWPKWGMFGSEWPASKKQPMPFTTSFVEYFNDIAWEIMTEMKIPIMDTYWLTLSRPDHREVDTIHGENEIRGKLVHAGPEVYSVMVRKWFMMILEAACPLVVPSRSADLLA